MALEGTKEPKAEEPDACWLGKGKPRDAAAAGAKVDTAGERRTGARRRRKPSSIRQQRRVGRFG